MTGDTLPGGPWALWAGGDAARAVLELRLPTRAWRDEGTAAALTGRWTVASADGRHVVWGLTPDAVTTVAVTLSDGRVVAIPTGDPGLGGAGVRAFAAQLPEGVTIAAAEGRRADGTAAVRARDVAESLAPVAGFDPAVRATLPVAPTPPA